MGKKNEYGSNKIDNDLHPRTFKKKNYEQNRKQKMLIYIYI